MKTIMTGLIALLFCMAFSACNKCHDDHNSGGGNGLRTIIGEWKLEQVYSNDHWGGAFYWKSYEDGTGVHFTANGEYYRNEAKAGTRLVGTYKVLSGTEVMITENSRTAQPYILHYDIDNNGRLTFHYNITEGVIKERFRRK